MAAIGGSLSYRAEPREVFSREVKVVRSALDCRQRNRPEMPAVMREIAIIAQDKAVMLGYGYLGKIR